jgi:hypothetical protein
VKIIEVQSYLFSAVVEDENGNRSTVLKQGNEVWKCLRCQRKRCEHACFVKQENPMLPEPAQLSDEDLADLIDE